MVEIVQAIVFILCGIGFFVFLAGVGVNLWLDAIDTYKRRKKE